MSDFDVFLNDELLQEFLDDAEESLSSLDSLIIEWEEDPSLNLYASSILRPLHTIKGNASIFGYENIENAAHETENIIIDLRDNKKVMNGEIASFLLFSIDVIRKAIARLKNGGPEVLDQEEFNNVAVLSVSQKENKEFAIEHFVNTISDDIKNLSENSQIAFKILKEHLEINDKTEGPIENIKTILQSHNWNEELPYEKSNIIIEQIYKAYETYSETNLLDEMKDSYETVTEAMGFDKVLRDILYEKIELIQSKTSENIEKDEPVEEEEEDNNTEKDDSINESTNHVKSKSMRVAESTIDNFLEFVGELLIIGDMYNNLSNKLKNNNVTIDIQKDCNRANTTFNKLSAELQASIMNIRKISANPLLNKAHRIIYDIAMANDKDIVVNISGENTLLDKSIMEKLDSPYLHIIRNAADHGIENTEKRKENGKDPKGTIDISLVENPTEYTLQIKDDGNGLDIEKLKEKGIKAGVLSSDVFIDQKDITDLIFHNGITTAENTTNISGRGVGMDAVKEMLNDANGKIAVDTKKGEGTKFTITIPKTVTTQIISGYIIELEDYQYILPLEKVGETFNISNNDIHDFAETGKCIERHGKTIPFISLKEVFLIKDSNKTKQKRTVVTCSIKDELVALSVDNVLGVQKVVVRELVGLVDQEFFSGATIAGDGSVSLLINPDKIDLNKKTLV